MKATVVLFHCGAVWLALAAGVNCGYTQSAPSDLDNPSGPGYDDPTNPGNYPPPGSPPSAPCPPGDVSPYPQPYSSNTSRPEPPYPPPPSNMSPPNKDQYGKYQRRRYPPPDKYPGPPSPGEYPGPSPGEYPGPSPDEYPGPSPGEYPEPSPDEYPGPSPGEYPGPSPDEYPGPSPDEYPEQGPPPYPESKPHPRKGQYPGRGPYPRQGQYPGPGPYQGPGPYPGPGPYQGPGPYPGTGPDPGTFRPGITGPKIRPCNYDGITPTAEALLAVTANQVNYSFIRFTRIRSVMAVSTANILGAAGLAAVLSIRAIIGYFIQLDSKVYYLSVGACPVLVYVPNDGSTVNNQDFLYGFQAYQAFSAFNSNFPYACSTCAANPLVPVPYQASPFQGISDIFVNELQTFYIVQNGVRPSTLQAKIYSTLRSSNVSAVVTTDSNCVTVADSDSVAPVCNLRPPIYGASDIFSNVVQGDNFNRRGICSYTIKVSEILASDLRSIISPIQIAAPISGGRLVLISCYTLTSIYDSISAPLLTYC